MRRAPGDDREARRCRRTGRGSSRKKSLKAGVTRARPPSPERPPTGTQHPPASPRATGQPRDTKSHFWTNDKFAPSYEDEKHFITVTHREPPKPPPADTPPPDPAPAPPATTLRGPTPDEILADPLVRTVLDVFEGEVKRVHPRTNKPSE